MLDFESLSYLKALELLPHLNVVSYGMGKKLPLAVKCWVLRVLGSVIIKLLNMMKIDSLSVLCVNFCYVRTSVHEVA